MHTLAKPRLGLTKRWTYRKRKLSGHESRCVVCVVDCLEGIMCVVMFCLDVVQQPTTKPGLGCLCAGARKIGDPVRIQRHMTCA